MTSLLNRPLCGTCQGTGRIADPWFPGDTDQCEDCRGVGRIPFANPPMRSIGVLEAAQDLLRALNGDDYESVVQAKDRLEMELRWAADEPVIR